MGDRSVELYFYSCPPEQTWALARVIEDYQLTENCGHTWPQVYQLGQAPIGPGPWELGYLEPHVQYLGVDLATSAQEIVAFLREQAPDARWDVWESPKTSEFMGERFIHDPDLGDWQCLCNSEGTPMFTGEQINHWVERAMKAGAMARRLADMEAAAAELAVERGEPWLEMPKLFTDKRIVPIRGYDHDARPDDMPEPGDRCKECGEDLIWMGPSQYDWLHVDDPRND